MNFKPIWKHGTKTEVFACVRARARVNSCAQVRLRPCEKYKIASMLPLETRKAMNMRVKVMDATIDIASITSTNASIFINLWKQLWKHLKLGGYCES